MSAKSTTRYWLAPALLAGAFLSGCQGVFVLAEKLFPKQTVPAKFKLPKKKIVLVFPDDLQNPVSYPPIKRRFARKLNELLRQERLAGETIAYEKLVELQAAEPKFNLMSIPKIGRKLGAELIVYLSIEEFTLKDNPVDTLWRGRFAGRAKVVDVVEGRIWPDESAGYPVSVTTPLAESSSEAFGEELAKLLAENLAVEVARLFHSHKVERGRPGKAESAFE